MAYFENEFCETIQRDLKNVKIKIDLIFIKIILNFVFAFIHF